MTQQCYYWVFAQEKGKHATKDLYKNVHRHFSCNTWKLATTQIPIHRRMDKSTAVNSQDGALRNNEKEWITDNHTKNIMLNKRR